MNLADELRSRIQAYLDNQISLKDLYHWEAVKAQAIVNVDEATFTELNDRVWILISEWFDSVRNEASVRAELTAMLEDLKELPASAGTGA